MIFVMLTTRVVFSCLKNTWRFHYGRTTRRTTRVASSFLSTPYSTKCSTVENVDTLPIETKEEEVSQSSTLPTTKLPGDERQAHEIIHNLSDEEKKKLKIIQYEYDLASMGPHPKIPSDVTDEMWLELLQVCENSSQRLKKMKFWYSIEKSRMADARKKERRRLLMEERRKEREEMGGHWNKILIHIRSQTMNKHYSNNLSNAILYGQHIVFDLDYDRFMKPQDIRRAAEQIQDGHGYNKVSKDPYHVVFCNARKQDQTMMQLAKYRQNQSYKSDLIEPYDLYTFTEKSYLDMYPKERIVYLSPNAPQVLKSYSNEDVYIIGAFVDQSDMKPRSYSKAKREGIRMAKLPLDQHLDWGLGNKDLTLDQMMAIMLEVKITGSWEAAFKYIPKRKLKSHRRFNQLY